MHFEGSRWYALSVRSKFEKVVSKNLQYRGIEEFLPTYVVKKKWSDRVKQMEFPLFPGYLFCKLDLKNRLPVLMVPGVNSIVGFGSGPKPIEESELDAIRTVVRSGLPCAPWPFLKEGERVEIERGPLEGLQGLVVNLKNTHRLVISVDMLMRSVAVEIDRESVRPVRSNSRSA